MLVYIDTLKMRAEVRNEIRVLKKLKQEVKNERANPTVDQSSKREAD